MICVQARKAPVKYDLPSCAPDLDQVLERKYLLRFTKELAHHGLVSLDIHG